MCIKSTRFLFWCVILSIWSFMILCLFICSTRFLVWRLIMFIWILWFFVSIRIRLIMCIRSTRSLFWCLVMFIWSFMILCLFICSTRFLFWRLVMFIMSTRSLFWCLVLFIWSFMILVSIRFRVVFWLVGRRSIGIIRNTRNGFCVFCYGCSTTVGFLKWNTRYCFLLFFTICFDLCS